MTYQVELWQRLPGLRSRQEKEWKLVRTLVPLRRGQPLHAIPFVFHGPSHSRPDVEKSPIEDLVAANLDHYRLNTDFDEVPLGAAELTALVSAWQNGAISRDTLLHNLRTGEILPSTRTNEQELELIRKEPAPVRVVAAAPLEAGG